MSSTRTNVSKAVELTVKCLALSLLCLATLTARPHLVRGQNPSGCCVCFDGLFAEPCNSATEAACALQTGAGRQCFWSGAATCSAQEGGCLPLTGNCTSDADCNDGHDCTVDTCNLASGVCFYSLASDGTSCDDGNPCTQSSTCQAGVCTGGSPVVCAPLDQCHVAGTCDPVTGLCSNPDKPNGTTCDDGEVCTDPDTCQAGICTGTPLTGPTCNDGNACTQTDTCQSGNCTGGNAVVCTPLDQCHSTGTCDPATGLCSNPDQPNGTTCNDGETGTGPDTCQDGICTGTPLTGPTCNDGNACTQTDTCQSGNCTGGNAVVCTPLDQCHSTGTCDPATGLCSNPDQPNGTTCNDGETCTDPDTCQAGICSGTPLTGPTCDDGNACTQTDTCESGVCTGSNPLADGEPCDGSGTCGATCQSGECSGSPKADGTTCDDGNACTHTDTCQSGTCTGGSPVVCTALDQCHLAGTCAPATGLCSEPDQPNGTTCNDSNACTNPDTCQAGICTGSPLTGASCNDGNACTQTDTCQSGTCTGGNPVVCTALDPCHLAGTCAPATGLCSEPDQPNGTTCNDSNACTNPDTCQAGICTGSPLTGPTCDDGNACTQTDSCQSGTCTGGSPVACSAVDQCHLPGTCSPVTGICSTPDRADGGRCDDGNLCTKGDECIGGICESGTQRSDDPSCAGPPMPAPAMSPWSLALLLTGLLLVALVALRRMRALRNTAKRRL
jgi:hypothetical protein